MITYGFYNSKNGDRKYDARQISSIFDGIIRDGIFMSIGNCFRVIPSEENNMTVLVEPGRAWFNHTWTLNDSRYPIEIPQSELLLNRIDAVVLDINTHKDYRVNSVMVVKGIPSNNPQNPTLINTETQHQYPLAYISVRAGVTYIRAADITSMVGTSATPYVTGILETVNIDALLDQWRDQWQEFFENQTQEIKDTNEFWKQEWAQWYEAQTNAIQQSYNDWLSEWELWSSNYETEMEETKEQWQNLWNAWFYTYVNQSQEEFTNWKQGLDDEFRTWFDSLSEILDGDVAANLANRILALESCCDTVKSFMENLEKHQTIYTDIQDDTDEIITDNEGNGIIGSLIFALKGDIDSDDFVSELKESD